MTVIYTDNFDSDTSGAIAPGWTAKAGTWAVGTNNPISGTKTFGTTTAADQDTALYTGSAALTYTKVQYTQKLVTTSSSAGHYSPVLRMDSAYQNGYVWLLDFNSTANKITPRLYKRTSGTFPAPQIGSTMSTTFAPGDILNVECISSGSTHEIRIWRSVDTKPTAPTQTFTEASYTSGYVGLFRTGAGVVGTAVDDFILDDGTAVSAATAVTLSGPTTGTVSVASSPFTIGANGTITGTVTVTPNDGGAGGTFNPTSVQITSASPTAQVTYTAGSTGARSIGVTNDGGLTNPTAITYTAAATGDTTPPTMNGTLTTSAITTTGFTLNWSAGSDNVGVTGYEYTIDGTNWNDVGNVLTKAVSGLASGTTYNPQVRDYDAAGNRSSAITTSVTTSSSTSNNVLTNGTSNVLFSPYNWDIGASSAKTINPGAYFKTLFTGSTCVLNFDMTNITSPVPQISYLVDGVGGWTTVNIAASVTIAVPNTTSAWNNKGGHVLEVVFKSSYLSGNRWTPQAAALVLTGIVLDAGATIAAMTAKPLRGLFFGDSITEGIRTMDGTYTNDMDRANSRIAWAYQAGLILGAEMGIVGFGSQGWTNVGSAGVPAFSDAYSLQYSGVARSFSPAPDFIAINHGTNDSVDVTSTATTVLNALLAATPDATKIIVFRPFKDATHATQLQSAIAACTNPARVTYVDTNGWFITSNSADTLHPYGNVSMNRLGPMSAAAIRTALTGVVAAPTLTSRTVTLTLAGSADTNGNPIPAANLAGMKIAFYDEATPDLHSVPRYKTSGGSTNASGVLTFNVQSTLPSGGTGCAVIQMADGRNVVTSVAVA
jgi:hypothetical protein